MSVQDAQQALSEGNALRAAGRPREAADAYRRAIAQAPQFGVGHYNLGIALRQAGEWRGAALAFREAARRDPADFDAMQNVVSTIALGMAVQERALFAAPPVLPAPAPGGVSIVVCTVDPRRWEALERNFRAALGDEPHELIAIRDARSLCEGYNRGLAAARHDTVVFSHDDVELLSPAPFAAVRRALAAHDVVGIVGATRAAGPAAMWAGQPHLRGWIAQPPASEAGFDMNIFSLDAGIVGGAQALDGLFFAARREAARRIGFDAATFDGFHLYDVDFSYRAHLAGLRVAITTEVSAIHASVGRFDERWKHYAERFRAKFPALGELAGASFAYAARVATRAHVARFFDELRGLAAIP